MTNPNPTIEYHIPTGEEIEEAKEYVTLGYKAVPVNDPILNALNFAERCLAVLDAVDEIGAALETAGMLAYAPSGRSETKILVDRFRAIVCTARGVKV